MTKKSNTPGKKPPILLLLPCQHFLGHKRDDATPGEEIGWSKNNFYYNNCPGSMKSWMKKTTRRKQQLLKNLQSVHAQNSLILQKTLTENTAEIPTELLLVTLNMH